MNNKKITKTTLFFLHSNEPRSKDLLKNSHNEAEKEILEIITQIEEDNFDIGDQKRPCQTCPYHHNSTCWKSKL